MSLRVELDPELHDDLRSRLIAIWTDVSNAGGAVGFVPPVTTDQVATFAVRAFARIGDGDGHLVVASIDAETVGFCFLEQRPGPLFTHWATIKRLQVHPSRQGRGLGSSILEEIHALAVERLRLEQLHLTVRGRTGIERFYATHGYREVARIPRMIRVAPGDDRDEIYMIKDLITSA